MGLFIWHHWRSIEYIFLSLLTTYFFEKQNPFFHFCKKILSAGSPFCLLKKITWSFFQKINNWNFRDYYRLDTIIKKWTWIKLLIFSQLKSWPQTIWYPMKKGVMAANQKQTAYSVHPMQNVPGVVILTHVMINPKTIHCVYTQIPNWGLISALVALISYIALTVYQPNLMGLVNG